LQGAYCLAPALPGLRPGYRLRTKWQAVLEENIPLWFNISHSGDDIAIVVSDEGEVGCDLEVIRPRKNVQRIAHAMFTDAEQQELASADEAQQSCIFWRIWTRKEAILKQCGSSVWQMNTLDSHEGFFISQFCLADSLVLAVCTAPCTSSPPRFLLSGLY
jgi:4'-phosphopantetheinyl transferase